ncbi:MAG TPA: aminotransferase class I/II-fold pyridoxal phosphate-dependent enzyme, partial [Candidatus Obscuribacterales bacterium]
LAGALIHDLPLSEDAGFLPDLDTVPADVAALAKVLVLNYPNNPTTATAPDDLLERSIWFCRRYEILLVHDLAYGELYFGRTRPRSILEFAGGKEIAVEFHTLSKTFNMAGWRIGFAVGNRHVIKTLYALKTNVDYGVFGAVQKAAIAALELPDSELEKIRNTYRQRRDILVEGYKDIGWQVTAPQATMYMWVRIPPALGMSSTEFAEMLLSKTGIVVTPGVAFGSCGEGYLRISMVAPQARLQEAMSRWRKAALTA